MSRETAEFGQKLNDLIRQTDALLEDLVVLVLVRDVKITVKMSSI